MSNTTQFEGASSSKTKSNANAIRAIDVLLSDITNVPTTPPRRKQNSHPMKRDTQAQSDSDDAALNSFSSSKEFAALLQSHVQKQQLLRRQRLQRQHEKQQQRLRDYAEYQQNLSRKNCHDNGLDDNNTDQEEDPEEDLIPTQPSELPNPFLSPPEDFVSLETRQRRPFKIKSKSGATVTNSTSTTATSTKPAISTTPSSSSTTAIDVARALPDPASESNPSISESGSIPSGVIPKRQYKKTILRQQAALLAAQIKDENEARDQEATRRVFARSGVLKHLRTLRSRLSYAHYKVDQGLEEQPLHIVAELFEDYTGDSGGSDDYLRGKSSRQSNTTQLKTTNLSQKHQLIKGYPSTPSMESTLKYTSTHLFNKTPEGDDERNSESEGSGDSRSSVEEIEMWKTPTKPRGSRTFIYSEDSDSDIYINNYTTPSKLALHPSTSTAIADRNGDFSSISLTQEDLLLQQNAQLEELQRKQRDQLRELKRMQKEQQLALRRAQTQSADHQRPTLDDEKAILAANPRGNLKPRRIHSSANKENTRQSKTETFYVKTENCEDRGVSPYISPVKHHTPLKARTLSLHHKDKLASPPPTPPHLNQVKSAPRSLSDLQAENKEQRSQIRRQPLGQLSDNLYINSSQNGAHSLSLKQQQQNEHRQRQQQKLQQNRQKEKELAQKQRLLEQQQQQQQKKKQLLLQLHQTHDLLQSQSQDTSSSRQRPLPSTSSKMKSLPGTVSMQTTPKKKKPLNPVQKAPSTENILASARSDPIVRSAMIATSPALAVAKNVLLGNKRGHTTFEDKENIGSVLSSPRSKETYVTQKNSAPSHARGTNSPKVYKRQKPEAKETKVPILSVSEPSAGLPITFTETDPISLSAVASSALLSSPSTLPRNIRTALDFSPLTQSISSPDPGTLSQCDSTEISQQSSKEFLDCFEQWIPETFSLDVGTQSDSIALTPLVTLPEVDENEVQSLSNNDDPNLQDGDSEQGDETELDETEIDRLLYSEIGEDYSSFGGQICESAPSSELGLQELTSDTGQVDLYDWFSDAAQDYISFNPNEQQLSLLSMSPGGISSSPADLTETLDLALEYDSTADLFWIQQEQQLQNLQLQQQHLSAGEIYEHVSPRSGTPQLDSTASTLLSSSYSDILPISVTGNNSNQYIPMGLDGGLIISNLQDKNERQDEIEHSPADDFATPTDNSTQYGIWNL
ncbi:hypothetical protein BGZ76_000544 [Entomortierella beljakovae]|nr:hypothetical protein BGZ76_000544 [Entomortierella beljakovae]